MSKTPNYDSAVKKILDQLVPGERVCALTGEKWFKQDFSEKGISLDSNRQFFVFTMLLSNRIIDKKYYKEKIL